MAPGAPVKCAIGFLLDFDQEFVRLTGCDCSLRSSKQQTESMMMYVPGDYQLGVFEWKSVIVRVCSLGQRKCFS
jgi:hypothetical protein